jgi:RHS repeat-associated protein
VGNLQSYAYPNAVQTSYTYNSLNRMTNLSINGTSTILASYAYTLGAAGHRLSVTEQSGRTVQYTYDDLYRLTQENITGVPDAAQNGVVDYTFDPVGNRLARTSTLAAIPSQTSTYDANDRLASETYDNNGNTIISNGKTYNFDWENHLTSVNQGAATYVYDGDGNRVAKSVAGVTTKYLVDMNNPTGYAQVLDEIVGGGVQRTYTYGNDLISENQLINGNWQASFYGYDGHGSVRLLSDSAGAVTDTYTYDAFGNLLSQTGSTPNERLYAGEQYDADLGFYYSRARYLNPQYGRFLSMDSFGGSRADPLSLHKYLYTNGDPVNMLDPSGHQGMSISENMMVMAMAVTIMCLATMAYVQTKDKIRDALEDITFTSPGPLVVPNPAPDPDPDPEPKPKPEPHPMPEPPEDDRPRRSINLDTSTAIAITEEGSTQRHILLAYIANREMIMCLTALGEFQSAVNSFGGPLEQARATRFMHRITPLPDNPSARAMALKVTGSVGANDKIIFGTGDSLGIQTMTGDAKFKRGAEAQGVFLDIYVHPPGRLRGL